MVLILWRSYSLVLILVEALVQVSIFMYQRLLHQNSTVRSHVHEAGVGLALLASNARSVDSKRRRVVY